MASKRKKIIAAAKEQVKNRRQDMLAKLSVLIKKREDLESDDCNEFYGLSNDIEKIFNEVKELDLVLERKDKKSKSITWKDQEYKPSISKKANNAKIVDEEAYRKSREYSSNISSGPVAKWLSPGILVKKRGSEMVGLVMETRSSYSTVLFGGCETLVRNLSLRPADWEN
tara:strand:+ start:175 stop:684 length:510 start_codon:yes stop_codon:yes gene_type:complete